MVLTARFRPGPTFMQGNDRSRLHLKGLQRDAYQMPMDKKRKAWSWSVWRRQWHPTPLLLPGKFHGQRSLVGCSPWGR